MEYLKKMAAKGTHDFKANALASMSQEIGLPHSISPQSSKMQPCVPQSYIDYCVTSLSQMKTFSSEAQASLISKVFLV